MAVATIQDYRRTDLRTNVLENPYWISSSIIDGAAVSGLKDKACTVFSFPVAGLITIVNEVILEVLLAFTATTVIDVGLYTLATDAVTTAGDATLVDVDEYIKQADITATTAGVYGSLTGATASDWLTAAAANTYAAPRIIVGAAATVPCVALTPATATIIVGKCRLHMLITNVPVAA